jgi:hypothetical protein
MCKRILILIDRFDRLAPKMVALLSTTNSYQIIESIQSILSTRTASFSDSETDSTGIPIVRESKELFSTFSNGKSTKKTAKPKGEQPALISSQSLQNFTVITKPALPNPLAELGFTAYATTGYGNFTSFSRNKKMAIASNAAMILERVLGK